MLTCNGVANLQENDHPTKPGMAWIPGRRRLTAAFTEEVLHQRSAFFFQDAFYNGGLWMKGPGGDAGFVYATAVAVLFIVGPKHYPAYFAPVQGACAHEAGFYGDIDGGLWEVFAAQEVEGGGESDDLSVGGTVCQSFCLVVPPGDDPVVENDDGADGDLVFGVGLAGLFEGVLHEMFVGHGHQWLSFFTEGLDKREVIC